MQKLTYIWNYADEEHVSQGLDFPDIIVNSFTLEVPDDEKDNYDRLLPVIVPAVHAALRKNKYNKIK